MSLTNRATHLCKCNGVADLKRNTPSGVARIYAWGQSRAQKARGSRRRRRLAGVGVGSGEEVPLPTGVRSEEGCAPPQKKYFRVYMMHIGAFLLMIFKSASLLLAMLLVNCSVTYGQMEKSGNVRR